VLANVLYFALMMASFVLGITLGFNLMEETGYLARISFLFDHTMSKVGLQGKTIIPFFMGLAAQLPVQPAHVSLITGDNVYLPLRCHGLFRVRQLISCSDNCHRTLWQYRRISGHHIHLFVYVSDDVGCIPYLR